MFFLYEEYFRRIQDNIDFGRRAGKGWARRREQLRHHPLYIAFQVQNLHHYFEALYLKFYCFGPLLWKIC